MIAALLLCCYPTLKRTRVEDPAAVPHRMQGGDFLQWLPQKTGGHDYDKSLFHALHGLIPSHRFTKSISGIIDAGANLWVNRPRCMFLRVLLLHGSLVFSRFFFFLSTILSPPRKSKEFSESNNKDNCKKLLVKAFDEPSKTVLVL